MRKNTLCVAAGIILLGTSLLAAPMAVPRYDQSHSGAFKPWFEGVETNLYDETGTFLLTYDDLGNHSNIHVGIYYPADTVVYDINKTDHNVGESFSEAHYKTIIGGSWFCAPTAAAMILKYWADNGYTNLADTEVNMIGNLAEDMKNCGLRKAEDDGHFSFSPVGRFGGIFRYVDRKGYLADFQLTLYSFVHGDNPIDQTPSTIEREGYAYTFQSVYGKDYGTEDGAIIYKNEIDNGRPVYISGRKELFGHAVTGVGYTDYKIIVNNYGRVKSYNWNCIAYLATINFESDPLGVQLDTPMIDAVLDGTRAHLSWSDVPDATDYKLYRVNTQTSWPLFHYEEIATLTETSYTDPCLYPGDRYYYCVVALNSADKTHSNPSDHVTVTVALDNEDPSEDGGGNGGCFISAASDAR